NDTLRRELRFTGEERDAFLPAPSPGRYVATMSGGAVSFVVNESAELLPARATVRDTTIAGAATGLPPAPLRDHWWAYALPLVALCGEWILRRRAGLR
ncbi:MAG TPA: hypothetical protein VHM30_17945, partial [Gemmatimonadaceae bacterium]|nr:hypothetical protein [Gemmatimonadaceae bacterium]